MRVQKNMQKKNIAIIGAGVSGITCARTLMKAGHSVTVFEKRAAAGGRMSSSHSNYGTFDTGVQYFTAIDKRFQTLVEYSLELNPDICKKWSASNPRLLNSTGRIDIDQMPSPYIHWVSSPDMSALPKMWAEEIENIHYSCRAIRVERDMTEHGEQWYLVEQSRMHSEIRHGGFDLMVLAMPAPQALELLRDVTLPATMSRQLKKVSFKPCWTLLLAYPQAGQSGLHALGPQWNAARSTHHRIGWLCRESSKPAREPIERWTVQANLDWSNEHFIDDPLRVRDKLQRVFTEVTGIRTQPAYADVVRWRYAEADKPFGKSHMLDAELQLGICGDWCLGRRVEDAFVSGLELALQVIKKSNKAKQTARTGR